MSKPNKLSRSRSRKKATQPTTNLNDSADDFSSLTSQNLRPDSQVELVLPATAVNRDDESSFNTREIFGDTIATADKETKKCLSDIFENGDASEPVPGVTSSSEPPPSTTAAAASLCPLCNKQAQPGHLKSCGIKHGLTTQQVVELRRMEERHREDRRKLGVPEVPVSASQHKSSRVRVPRKKAEAEGAGADPDLALALALSISAASSVGGERVEQSNEREAEVKRMWLPQVSLKRRGKRVVGLTVLQSRSEVERERIIGEKVARVLEEEMGEEGTPDSGGRKQGDIKSSRAVEKSSHYWSLAAKLDLVKTAELMADKLENYLQVDSCTSHSPPPAAAQPAIPPPAPACQAQSLAVLSSQWIALLHSGQASDMTILCKEEVEVPCHSLVVTVRCPVMMKTVVREGSGQMFLVMDQYEHTVVRVVLQYLYGGVLDTEQISDIEQLVQLRKMVNQYKMKELIYLVGELVVEEVDEDMEEEESMGNECAGDKVVCGTQSLNKLLDCLDSQNSDGDDWEEVCEYMTQRRRSLASEDVDDKVEDSNDKEIYSKVDDAIPNDPNCDQMLESEPELSLRLEESFQSDSSNQLKSLEKMREPCQVKEKRSSYLQEADVSLCRAEPSYSSSTETVPIASSPTPKLSVVSRSSSPDMFDMSDDDSENAQCHAVTKPPTQSPPRIQTGVKRKNLSTSPSPHKRHCPDHFADELPTPVKYPVSPDTSYSEQIVDLTQPTPPDQVEIVSPDSPVAAASPGHVSIICSSPARSFHQTEDHELHIEDHMSPPTLPSCNSPNQEIFPPPPPSPKLAEAAAESHPPAVSLPPPPSIDPPGDPPSLSEAEIIFLLTSISSLLEEESSTPSVLVSGLVKLATVPVTVPALLSTGVGKVVRRLKDREGKVGRLAGKLVSRWKRIVLQYEPQPSTGVGQAVSDAVIEEPVAALVVAGKDVREVVNREDGYIEPGRQGCGDIEVENINNYENGQVEDLNRSQAFKPIIHRGSERSHSVLDQTGLGSSPTWQMDQENIDEHSVQEEVCGYDEPAVQEEPFDYELPIQQEPSEYDHPVQEEPFGYEDEPCVQEESFDYELPIQQEPSEYDLPAQEEPCDNDLPECDNVWDDFDEGAVSIGMEHDKFALAESSDMCTSANDPAAHLATPTPTHHTPLRRSISEPLYFSPAPLPSASAPHVPVTPLPDYQAMHTPILKAELKRFGLKAVPRRKACLLLNHIYEQTHPLVPATPLPPGNRLLFRPDPALASQTEEDREESDSDLSQASTCSQDSQVPHMPEESIIYDQEDMEDCTPSQVPTSDNLHSQLSQFLTSRPSLLQSVLLYQPLWLGELTRDIKEAGVKCKAAQLQDWLDIHCITFRTESSRNRNKANSEPAKTKCSKEKEPEEVLTEAAPARGKSKRGHKKK